MGWLAKYFDLCQLPVSGVPSVFAALSVTAIFFTPSPPFTHRGYLKVLC